MTSSEHLPVPVHVSIHDVMPHTLTDVAQCISLCRHAGFAAITLLVVPGCAWTPAQLDQVRRWHHEGLSLAGHGWSHRRDSRRPLRWRAALHAKLISRHCGEHLPLRNAEGLELIRRCHAWFGANGLPSPSLYVPPAWTLGDLPYPALQGLPFDYVEVLSGWVDTRSGDQANVPLLGYEADTRFRAGFLDVFNGINRCWARSRGLRVAIHPADHRLLLGARLRADLTALGAAPTRLLWPGVRPHPL